MGHTVNNFVKVFVSLQLSHKEDVCFNYNYYVLSIIINYVF